ncbi:unnamed protein product [Polarella glacialis]|uniref:Class I SAM-dependent methyltransferase n=1 Tax=Polarella glacialis TaxID=89957 RepID=A0A813FAW6_POLGL|nr:unnamed protein product [Polarella glacialis]
MSAGRLHCVSQELELSFVPGISFNASWLGEMLQEQPLAGGAALLAVASELCAAGLELTRLLVHSCNPDSGTRVASLAAAHLPCAEDRDCVVGRVRNVVQGVHVNLARRARGAVRHLLGAGSAPGAPLLESLESLASDASAVSLHPHCSDLAENALVLSNVLGIEDHSEESSGQCGPLVESLFFCMQGLAGEVNRRLWRLAAILLLDSVRPRPRWRLEESLGWRHSEILLSLLKGLERPGHELRVAELGAAAAATSVALLQHFPSLRMLLVDPYFLLNDNSQRHDDFARATEALKPFRSRATLIMQASAEAATWASRPDASLDLVFVDGDHSYVGAMGDIEAWWPALRTGGVLAGHDYIHPGVVQAAHEFAVKMDLELTVAHAMFWIVKP